MIFKKEESYKMSSEPENCSNNCASCGADCARREPQIPIESTNEYSHVKKVIGIVSGKGGVGKSLMTSLCAVSTQRMGYSTAILDADLTGPSIPRMFGLKSKAYGSEEGMLSVESDGGIRIMSINLILDNETDPVAWRGPILSGVVKQFWSEVVWGDVDFMFVDMPPGTGDVLLTVFQSLPVDGIIVVTSPQELVSMIVEKAVKMAESMNIPILGIIENMSYYTCPDCGKRLEIFGKSHVDSIAGKYNIPVLATLPFMPEAAALADEGGIEGADLSSLDDLAASLRKLAV